LVPCKLRAFDDGSHPGRCSYVCDTRLARISNFVAHRGRQRFCHCPSSALASPPTRAIELRWQSLAESHSTLRASTNWETSMPAAKKPTTRGRAQDRSKVAGGQEHEVRYEAKKSGKPAAAVKKAVKSEGNSRKKVESALSR
jgi:hypothetical protein